MSHVSARLGTIWSEAALDQVLLKLARLRDSATGFPVATAGGKWQFSAEGTWTAGFWPGRLWLAYLLTGDSADRDAARHWCTRLAPHQLNRATHDLGMMFMPAFVAGYQVTGEKALRHGALAAAETLAGRFNARGRFIRAIGAPETTELSGYTIIDTLMNLPLLFWAGRESGQRYFVDIALAHTQTSMARHLRPDGSTLQVFNFDPANGAPIGPGIHQALSIGSCWSRGQAWAIAGLAAIYRWTSDPEILAAAQRVADWWLAQAPSDAAPPWDFSAGPGAPRDASAAAIAACGLLDLAGATGLSFYAERGAAILQTLWLTCADSHPAEDGLLLHATGFFPAGRDVDVSLSYGDYFYVLGLVHLARRVLYTKTFEIGVT